MFSFQLIEYNGATHPPKQLRKERKKKILDEKTRRCRQQKSSDALDPIYLKLPLVDPDARRRIFRSIPHPLRFPTAGISFTQYGTIQEWGVLAACQTWGGKERTRRRIFRSIPHPLRFSNRRHIFKPIIQFQHSAPATLSYNNNGFSFSFF